MQQRYRYEFLNIVNQNINSPLVVNFFVITMRSWEFSEKLCNLLFATDLESMDTVMNYSPATRQNICIY